MLPAQDALHLVRWTLPAAKSAPAVLALPDDVSVQPVPVPNVPDADLLGPGIEAAGPAITRSQVLQRADAFVRLDFNASSCNIGSRVCTKTAISPDWVTVGAHTQVPYAWGGFSSVDGVSAGLAACKLAGDRNTTNGAASCAVGVDCSGFVSRAWNTTSKYGTATLYQVTTAIAAADSEARRRAQ